MLSPFQLKQSLFTEVSLKVHPQGLLQAPTHFNMEGGFAVRDEGKGLWEMSLTLVMKEPEPTDQEPSLPAPFAYHGRISVVGLFQVHPGFLETALDKRDNLLRVNGSSILYGIIREMVSLLTLRSKPGHYLLPSINFSAVLKDISFQQRSMTPVFDLSDPDLYPDFKPE